MIRIAFPGSSWIRTQICAWKVEGVHNFFGMLHPQNWILSLKLTAKAPENRPGPNRKVVFQPSIFRGELLVSGRVCSVITTVFLYEKTCMATKDTRRGTIESRLVYGGYISQIMAPQMATKDTRGLPSGRKKR